MSFTIDSRKNFVENITKLSLWLTRKYCSEGMQLEEAFSDGTPVYRLTTLWDGINHPAHPSPGWYDKRWESLLEQLKFIFTHHQQVEKTDTLEDEGLELLWPFLAPRIKQDSKLWPWIPSVYGTTVCEDCVFGFFLYGISESQPRKHKQLDLHMGNCFAPNSPFKDMQARANELEQLLENARTREPNLRSVCCGSWLNSFKPFQTLFPPEWCKNSSPASPIAYGYDLWGQMMSRSGGYHKRNGDYLRENGKFPYEAVKCKCTIESLLRHLHNTFKERMPNKSLHPTKKLTFFGG